MAPMPEDFAAWQKVLTPDTLNISDQAIRDVFENKTKSLNFIARMPSKSGEDRHVEVWGLINPDESVLAGGVAHDFNNILMSVLGYAELMEADLLEAPELNGTQLKHSSMQNIEEIRTAAVRASDLCSSLLAYAGQHLVEKKKLDLSQLVRSTTEMVEVTIGKRVPLVLDLDDEIPIFADRGQLTQVIINLVANAADAMEGYSGAVRLEVTQKALSDKERALLRDQIEGRGLGMAAVHGIVKNHNGGILLTSAEGEGTEFMVCLPLVDQLPLSQQPEIEQPQQNTRPQRVLVVDDESGVRTIAAEMLRHLNCEVCEADSAEAALGFLAKQEFDCALVDITMPVMSGTELAELLLERLPNLRVVLCSGYTDKDLPEALLARCAFIHKPFTLKEVSDTMGLAQVIDEDALDSLKQNEMRN